MARGGAVVAHAPSPPLRSAAGEDLESIQYEAHGPGGVAYILDVLTDNKNRTVAQLRHLFKEAGGAALPRCAYDPPLPSRTVSRGGECSCSPSHGSLCSRASAGGRHATTGALGAAGSASWMFDRLATLTVRVREAPTGAAHGRGRRLTRRRCCGPSGQRAGGPRAG